MCSCECISFVAGGTLDSERLLKLAAAACSSAAEPSGRAAHPVHCKARFARRKVERPRSRPLRPGRVCSWRPWAPWAALNRIFHDCLNIPSLTRSLQLASDRHINVALLAERAARHQQDQQRNGQPHASTQLLFQCHRQRSERALAVSISDAGIVYRTEKRVSNHKNMLLARLHPAKPWRGSPEGGRLRGTHTAQATQEHC